jgi:hypothetical protein
MSFLAGLILACMSFQIPLGGITAGGAAVTHTFTAVQKLNSSGNCNGLSSCTLSGVSSIGTGHVAVVIVTYGSSSSRSLTSVSDGHSTYTLAPGTSTCYNSSFTPGTLLAWTGSTVSGGTSVTVNLGTAPTGGWAIDFREYSYTPNDGGAALDSATSLQTNSSANPFPGVTPVISGSSDLIVQFAITDSTAITAINASYGNLETNAGGMADRLNTTSTTQPSWTVPGANNGCSTQISVK